MIGEIVKVEGSDDLFVSVNEVYREDAGSCCYNRDYYLFPYNPTLDDLKIQLHDPSIRKVCVTHKDSKNPVVSVNGKKHYTMYGESNIRGIKTLYLERKWDDTLTR